MGEIALFFRAISARSKENLYDLAVANRLGQSTRESWRDFSNSLKASVRQLTHAIGPKTKRPVKRGDDALAELFGQVLKKDANKQVLSKTLGELHGDS